MIDRTFKINNAREGFDKDIKDAKRILQKNGYPENIIDKNIKNYLDDKNNPPKEKPKTDNCKYFKLPYIGEISEHADKKIKQLMSQYCKVGTLLKIAFTPIKLSSFFSLKDKVLDDLISHVVYKFTCAGCNASYLGYTTRYFTTRIKEHLHTDKNSHVFKHLQSSSSCKEKCSSKCFKIIDRAPTNYSLRVKESIWIKSLEPQLNIQLENVIQLNLYI